MPSNKEMPGPEANVIKITTVNDASNIKLITKIKGLIVQVPGALYRSFFTPVINFVPQ
jgi:hypothetical protein